MTNKEYLKKWHHNIFPFGSSRFTKFDEILIEQLTKERIKLKDSLGSHNNATRDLILQKSDQLRDKYDYVNNRYISITQLQFKSRIIRFAIILFFILTVTVYFPGQFDVWGLCYLLIGLQIQHLVANYLHDKIESTISSIVDEVQDEVKIKFDNSISSKSYFKSVLFAFFESLLLLFAKGWWLFWGFGLFILFFGEDMLAYIWTLLVLDNLNLSYYVFLFVFLVSYFPLLKLLFVRRF